MLYPKTTYQEALTFALSIEDGDVIYGNGPRNRSCSHPLKDQAAAWSWWLDLSLRTKKNP